MLLRATALIPVKFTNVIRVHLECTSLINLFYFRRLEMAKIFARICCSHQLLKLEPPHQNAVRFLRGVRPEVAKNLKQKLEGIYFHCHIFNCLLK